MDKHSVLGRAKEAEGKIKEETGKVTGNRNLQDKGNLQKNAGKVEAGYGDVKSDVKKEIKKNNY